MSDEYEIHPVTGEKLLPAKPAATIIIFRDSEEGDAPQILMVERIKAMAFAGGAAVFPGGKVDDADFEFAASFDHGLPQDEAAARIAAIRETIEEAGLAVALLGVADASDCAGARAALHGGDSLQTVCARHGWVPELHQLTPWARWRPPRFESHAFDTRFYLFDTGGSAVAASVDNSENKALFWETASGVLERNDRGEVRVIFPTKRNLERLAMFSNFADTAAHARSMKVTTLYTYSEDRDGVHYICIPDGFGYPVLEEAFTPRLRG